MPKSKHQIPGRVRSTYAFIKAHRDRHSVEMMCRVREVAPERLLRMAEAPDLEPRARRRPAPPTDSRVVRRESWHLWRASRLPGSA